MKDLLVKETSDDRDDIPDSDWCDEEDLPEETMCKVEGLKTMARWLLGKFSKNGNKVRLLSINFCHFK